MGDGLLKVGAAPATKRAVSSEASGTRYNVRNNQSFWRCCAAGRSEDLHTWVLFSVRTRRETDRKAETSIGGVEEEE
jgi:hypothetical protein